MTRALSPVVGLALVILMVPAVPAGAVDTPLVSETFAATTSAGFVAPPAPYANDAVNMACLTAGTDPSQTPLPGCNFSPADPAGSGVLQLTTGSTFDAEGGVFSQSSVPSAAGLDVSFDSYQYAPTGSMPADGIAFVVAAANPEDPTSPAYLGDSGGSLGYASENTGLPDGYLGVGLDVYGDYIATGFEPATCTEPSWASIKTVAPDQVTVRGPGTNGTGYCPLASTFATDAGAPVALEGTTRAKAKVPVAVAINTGSSAMAMVGHTHISVPARSYTVVVTDLSGKVRNVSGPLPTTLNGGIPAGTIPASWINPSTGLPYLLTFGLIGATGGSLGFHAVSNLTADSLNGTPVLLGATNTDSYGGKIVSGKSVTWSIAPSTQSAGGTEKDAVSVVDTFSGEADLSSATGTGWNCSIASPNVAVTSNTVTCTYLGPESSPVAPGTSLSPISILGTTTAPLGAQINSTALVSSVDGVSTTATDQDTVELLSSIAATPAVLQVSPLAPYLLTLHATLTGGVDNVAIAGQTISFVAGTTALCSAVTNAAGAASCSTLTNVPGVLSAVLADGYQAVYAGSSNYTGSTASAGLIG